MSKHSHLINIQLNFFAIVLRNWPLLTPPTPSSPILLPLTAPPTSVAFLCPQMGLDALAPVPLQPEGAALPSHLQGDALASSSERQSVTTKAKLAPTSLPNFHLLRTVASLSAVTSSMCLYCIIFLYILFRPRPFPHYNLNSRRKRILSYPLDGSPHEPTDPA